MENAKSLTNMTIIYKLNEDGIPKRIILNDKGMVLRLESVTYSEYLQWCSIKELEALKLTLVNSTFFNGEC